MLETSSTRRPLAQLSPAVVLVALFAVGVAVKIWIVRTRLPSIWLWRDEYYYAATAYDLGHPTGFGVPHTDFLFYPPVTSLVILPYFHFGLDFSTSYQLSVITLNILASTTIFAAYLLYKDLFGVSSRFVPALLLFGAPAYTALMLMSEPTFIALYAWLLVFLVRALRDERLSSFLAVGVLAGLMSLTRRTGLAVVPGLVGCYTAFYFWNRGGVRRRPDLKGPIISVVVAIAIQLGWHIVSSVISDARGGGVPLMEYLRRGIVETVSSPSAVAHFARRFGANIGYVSLSTFGILVPVVVWALIRPSRSGSWLVRLVALHVAIVAVVSAFVGATHMTVYAPPLNPLPRWDMYGRYMEHLAFPVTVLGFGLLATARRSPVAEKLWVVGLTIAAGVTVWAVVPYSFFTRSMPNQIAPNSLGIAALIRFADGQQLWWLAMTGASAAVCVALVLGRGRLALISAPIAVAALLGASLWNFQTAAQEVSRSSRAADRDLRVYAEWVDSNPDLFPSGLCVDFEHVGASPVGFVETLYLVAENLEQVRTTREPESCLGQLPLVTYRVFDGYQILFEDEVGRYRIYSTQPTS